MSIHRSFTFACAILILAYATTPAVAQSERDVIVSNVQSATWAYHTDQGFGVEGRWYISYIHPGRTDVFSLGPLSNGQAAWWTVGRGVAAFDASYSNISFDPNLDTDPSDTFWDIGLNQWVTNPLIHSDRQRLQGKTVPVKWYFFHAPNGSWYIVNALGYGTSTTVLRFAERNGQYDWPPVDVSGYTAQFAPSPDGSAVQVRFVSVPNQQLAFLSFPLPCGDSNCTFQYSQGAYTPSTVNSVLDHSMTSPYTTDGVVTAFTGETGRGEPTSQGCYPKVGGGSFSVDGLYRGTAPGCLPNEGLNYDGHPGYDYYAEFGTTVRAAARGVVVNVQNQRTGKYEMCVPRGIETAGCAAWGFLGIDHGDGYIVQYGHLSRIDVSPGQTIAEGQVIGLSGNTAPVYLGPHLHFEVLKAKPGVPYGYTIVDPYGWEGPAGNDPLANVTGIPNVRLWK